MSTPKVLVTEDAYHITLSRNGCEKTFSFFGAALIVTRTDDEFPVEGDLDEEGYLYFIQAFYIDGTSTEIYVDPEEADQIVNLILDQTGENVGDY